MFYIVQILETSKFNNFLIYSQSLITLNELIGVYVNSKVNIHEEREKLPDLTYKMLEILLKIYEFIPLKLDKKESRFSNGQFDPCYHKLNDHLFSSDLEFDFLTRGLKKIPNDFESFFLFNSFARNVLEHHKHNISCMGEGSVNENITSLNYRLSIVQNTSRAYKFLYENFIKEPRKIDKRIIIEKNDNLIYLWMYIDTRTVSNIISRINKLFLEGYEILRNMINESHGEMFSGNKKQNYLRVVDFWAKSIENSRTTSK